MPGLLKIGQTATDPEGRRRALHTTGVPTPFVLEYYVFANDYEALERRVHSRLSEHREGTKGVQGQEFFRIKMRNAIDTIRSESQREIEFELPASRSALYEKELAKEQRQLELAEEAWTKSDRRTATFLFCLVVFIESIILLTVC